MKLKENLLPTLSLFTSVGTLLCCALPALLVTIGAGAALVGLIGFAPWLVTLSKYKIITFGVAGFLLIIAGIARFKSRNLACPIDKKQAVACKNLRRFSGIIYYSSVLIYLIGFFFAFIAVRIFY